MEIKSKVGRALDLLESPELFIFLTAWAFLGGMASIVYKPAVLLAAPLIIVFTLFVACIAVWWPVIYVRRLMR